MKQRMTRARQLARIEAEIAQHVAGTCDSCTASVTAFGPVCATMSNLRRKAGCIATGRAR